MVASNCEGGGDPATFFEKTIPILGSYLAKVGSPLIANVPLSHPAPA